MPKNMKIVFAISIFVVASLAIGSFYIIKSAEESVMETLNDYGKVPDFTFTESGGAPFGLANMKGKINVVDFIFTSCPSACPMMSRKMAKLYQQYKDNDEIQFVSISVDPEVDTLPVMSAYLKKYGVRDNRWVFLRSDVENVVNLSEKGFMLSAQDLPMGHSLKFALVDGAGTIKGYYDSESDASIKIMKDHIKEILSSR